MSGDQVMRGTIWISGRNYVTSLPTDFGKEVAEKHSSEVDKLYIDQKIVITPAFDPFKKRTLENVKIYSGSDNELTMKIVSAYLDGYDVVQLSDTAPIGENMKRTLLDVLPGISFREKVLAKKYEIMFSDIYEISLKDTFGRIKEIYSQLGQRSQEAFGVFPDAESVKNIMESNISILERELDYTAFQLRRYLNKCLIYPEFYEKLELASDRDIIHLTSIFCYFERLGDLHEEIVEQLFDISQLLNRTDKSDFRIDPFLPYYVEAHKTILKSVDAQSDAWKGLEIINHKSRKWKDHILNRYQEEVKNLIFAQKDPKFVRELVILEGKIRAMPDLSSNICELAWNKDRNAREKPPQD